MNEERDPFKVLMTLIIICLVVFIIFECVVYTKYADTTVSELPSWVFWLLH